MVLDRTVFYPGGGGQPADQGWLMATDGTRWMVRTARREDGAIVHEVVTSPDVPLPPVGATLTSEVDWERRHLLMRTHTALHALCGVVWRDHGALVTGGNMEPGKGRMDFEFESLSAELASSIEVTVNAELAEARTVSVRFLTLDEAAATPDLIRTRTNLLPEGITEVRVIDIEGLDMQADGGTHVANTREVGSIRIDRHRVQGPHQQAHPAGTGRPRRVTGPVVLGCVSGRYEPSITEHRQDVAQVIDHQDRPGRPERPARPWRRSVLRCPSSSRCGRRSCPTWRRPRTSNRERQRPVGRRRRGAGRAPAWHASRDWRPRSGAARASAGQPPRPGYAAGWLDVAMAHGIRAAVTATSTSRAYVSGWGSVLRSPNRSPARWSTRAAR